MAAGRRPEAANEEDVDRAREGLILPAVPRRLPFKDWDMWALACRLLEARWIGMPEGGETGSSQDMGARADEGPPPRSSVKVKGWGILAWTSAA